MGKLTVREGMYMVLLIIVLSILWVTVSLLCINHFCDFSNCTDEWDELPLFFQFPVMVVAPLLYVFWSR